MKSQKKQTIASIIFLLCLSLITLSPAARASEDIFLDAGFIQAKKPVSALEFTLEDLNGRPVNSTSFEGKTTLLYFWATW